MLSTNRFIYNAIALGAAGVLAFRADINYQSGDVNKTIDGEHLF